MSLLVIHASEASMVEGHSALRKEIGGIRADASPVPSSLRVRESAQNHESGRIP